MMLRSLTLLSLLSTATAFVPSSAFTPRSSNNAAAAISSSRNTNTLSMVAVDTSDIKNGLTIELDGEPYKVLNFSIMKQARGAAKTTIKFKNLMRGNTIENTYRSGEKFETATIEKTQAQYTYPDDTGNFFFMDTQSFEEVMVESKTVDSVKNWISEGMECTLVYFKGSVIEVIVPSTMVFEVVETEPNVKGNTSQGHTKPAVLDCGATVTVPGFVEVGTKVKVDTERGEYLERA